MRLDEKICRLSAVYQGKIEDFTALDQNVAESDRFYLLFDSHYYLKDWQPRHHGRVLLVGGDFCSHIGAYRLPLGEG